MEKITIQSRKLTDNPVPLWFVNVPGGKDWFRPPFNEIELSKQLGCRSCVFRAIGNECLERVLKTGIDVEPTDAVIFADCFEKAWEYGGWPKVMLALRYSKLECTYREVSATIPPDELAKLRQSYPTMVKSLDGTKLWLSRLAEDDPRITGDYETVYARWIEGNPFDALQAVIMFVRPEDETEFVKAVNNQ